jgi:hypothetical protein
MTELSNDTNAESTVTPTQLMWRVWAGVIVLPLLLTAVGLYADVTGVPPERNVKVAVTGTFGTGDTPAKIGENSLLLLRIQIYNGLENPIQFPSLATKTVASNLETQNIAITAVYRQVDPAAAAPLGDNLLEVAPKMDDAVWKQSSPSLIEIESGTSTVLLTALRKWQIRGGWTPGTYEVQAKVSGISVDQFSTMSILSEPIRFEIVPAKPDQTANAAE